MTDLLTRPAAIDEPPTILLDTATTPDPRRTRPWRKRVAGGAVALVLIAGGGSAGAYLMADYLAGAPAVTAGAVTTLAEGGDLAPIVAAVQPSVVTVLVDSARSSSLGSGVVLSGDGLILTNNHVIESDGSLSVRLSDGRTVPARLVAADATHDLALVRATGLSGLTPVTFATDDSAAVGDTVLAFGAPLGLENTVTSGIVSALDRSLDTGDEQLSGLLQTDAAINQGNSGGALVDTSGRVVGINVAIATAGDSTGSAGLGFAIPADTVTGVVARLEAEAARG